MINKTFENLHKDKSKWISIIFAKNVSKDIAEDIFQNAIFYILKALNDNRKSIDSISKEGIINQCYFYKVIIDQFLLYVRNDKSKYNCEFIEALELANEDTEPDGRVEVIKALKVPDLDLVIQNKYNSVTLTSIAEMNNTNYTAIQRRVTTAISEIQLQLNG